MPTRKSVAKAAPADSSRGTRKRLSPDLRRMQIMDAAALMVVKQGFLPLPAEQLAKAAGTSKALIYTYFPTQYELFNGLLSREFDALKVAGLDTAARVDDLDQAVMLSAMLYFEHVAQHGPLLHIMMTDLFMKERHDPKVIALAQTLAQKIVRLAEKELPFSGKEISMSMRMLAAIPEESGSLAFHGELDVASARLLCSKLISSTLVALRSPDKIIAAAIDGA